MSRTGALWHREENSDLERWLRLASTGRRSRLRLASLHSSSLAASWWVLDLAGKLDFWLTFSIARGIALIARALAPAPMTLSRDRRTQHSTCFFGCAVTRRIQRRQNYDLDLNGRLRMSHITVMTSKHKTPNIGTLGIYAWMSQMNNATSEPVFGPPLLSDTCKLESALFRSYCT